MDAALPQLVVRNVLVDVDDTLTCHTGDQDENPFLSALLAVLVSDKGVAESDAARHAAEAYDPEHECISRGVARLGIDPKHYWDELMPQVERCVRVYPDALEMLESLCAMGFRLHPATTNSGLTIRAKLAVAGLATRTRSAHFGRLLGGSEVDAAGKSGPRFFRKLVQTLGLAIEDTVMVGDNPVADLAYAREAGVPHVILVQRDQPQPCRPDNQGNFTVSRLSLVPRMLVLPPGPQRHP